MSKALRIRHASFGRVAILDLDRPLIVHAHSQSHVLIKVDGSDTTFCVRDRAMPLSAERAVLVNPWEAHSYPHACAPKRAIIIAIYLNPRSPSITDEARFPCTSVAVSLAARRLADLLYAELALSADGSADDTYVEQLMPMLLSALTAGAGSDRDLRATADFSAIGIDRRLQRAIEYMDEHLDERLDLAQLARHSGLSRPHFFELFRRRFHMTPAVYWNMLRMESAVQTLAGTQVPIGSLAIDLGFTAQSNFTRFFRDIQGIGPRQYREASSYARELVLTRVH